MKMVLILAIFLLAGLAIANPSRMIALASESERQDLDNRNIGLTSQGTFKRLQRALNYLDGDKFERGLDILLRLEKTTKNRPYELAQVQQNIAFAYAQKGDYKNSIVYFEKVLAKKNLPAGPTLMGMYTLAQLLMTVEKYRQGIEVLKKWFSFVEKPGASAYALMATALSETKQKREALKFIDKGISLSLRPKENWLQFSVSLNFELKKYHQAIHSLEILTSLYPNKKQYWKQLSGAYFQVSNVKKALATLELAQKWGHLTEEAEILNLASLYLARKIPYRAALIIEHFMKKKVIGKTQKNYEILAQSWMMAEEVDRALEPMQQAAALSKNGKSYAQLGQIYIEREQWDKAIESLNLALKRNGMKTPAKVHLLLGIAYFNLKNVGRSVSYFDLAKLDRSTQKQATQWSALVLSQQVGN